MVTIKNACQQCKIVLVKNSNDNYIMKNGYKYEKIREHFCTIYNMVSPFSPKIKETTKCTCKYMPLDTKLLQWNDTISLFP